MSLITIIIIAISVSMDAGAICISDGMSLDKIRLRTVIKAIIAYGGMCIILPFIGYNLGESLYIILNNYDHFVAYFILVYLGAAMIFSFSTADYEKVHDISFTSFLKKAFLTSIDSAAAGFTVGATFGNIYLFLVTIFIMTTFVVVFSLYLGNKIGDNYIKNIVFIAGGCLIINGFSILITDLIPHFS